MGYPLSDITIYFDGYVVNVQERDGPYRIQANYIADLYYANLNEYKPSKTARICLHLVPSKVALFKTSYFGSILSCFAFFSEEDLISKEGKGLELHLLNVLHEAILNIAKEFSWDEEIFLNAYSKCVENDLQFIKEYPEKKSRDRSIRASIVIKKDLQTTYTYIRVVSDNSVVLHKVFETVNYGCFDIMYGLSKKTKWIDNDSFGFVLEPNNVSIFFSAEESIVKVNIKVVEGMEEKEKLFIRATTEKTDINPFYLTSLYLAKMVNLKD